MTRAVQIYLGFVEWLEKIREVNRRIGISTPEGELEEDLTIYAMNDVWQILTDADKADLRERLVDRG